MTADRVLTLDPQGPHHAFAVGRLSAPLQHDFQLSLSEALQDLKDGAESLTLWVYGAVDHLEVPRLAGEQQLHLLLADNALPDAVELRRQVVRTLKFMNRPLTPDDPDFFVPERSERMQA